MPSQLYGHGVFVQITQKTTSWISAQYTKCHKPEKCGPQSTCVVCKLDWNLERKKLRKECQKAGLTSDVARCRGCAIIAHDRPCQVTRTMHSLSEFQGLTCFEIAYATLGFELWNRHQKALTIEVHEKKRSYKPKTSHPTYLELAKRIGAAPKKAVLLLRAQPETATSIHHLHLAAAQQTRRIIGHCHCNWRMYQSTQITLQLSNN